MSDTIASNYRNLKEKIRKTAEECDRNFKDLSLIAVSKGRTWAEMLPLYMAGQRAFGESRPQELLSKMEAAPHDVGWHFIGNLQRNKVRKIVGKVKMIHSVSSYPLALKIAECSEEIGIVTSILLEVNISGEESKSGYSQDQWIGCFPELMRLPSISIVGLMTMAPELMEEGGERQKHGQGGGEIVMPSHMPPRACFAALRGFRDYLQERFCVSLPKLSMGMSSDYEEAIAEGATMLRIGSLLWASLHI